MSRPKKSPPSDVGIPGSPVPPRARKASEYLLEVEVNGGQFRPVINDAGGPAKFSKRGPVARKYVKEKKLDGRYRLINVLDDFTAKTVTNTDVEIE